ncbi:MAG TPA: TIR domain-containing protein, partial [Ktedonobacteraceae bacterium]|nr:TIR domain-containing protein [Ktedonobacteraceae bacterium]
MGQDDQPSQPEQTDFFVSYVSSDQDWAEWLGMQVEQAGYTVFVEAWDVRPGDNRVLALNRGLQRAERVLVVLSPAYFQTEMVQTQWAAALLKDQTGTHRRVLPVLIETCGVDGLLRGLVCIDLVGVDEQTAQTRLLAGLQTERTRPASVAFPARQGTGAAFPGKSLMWTMPFARNPYFTGREEQLRALREQLQAQRSAAIGQIQAITGLGGIGKTQMAVEYAYRHREEYAQVFWVRADTVETLASSYGEMARLLDLPERNAQEQAVMIQAVNRWLREHRDYLLILDNADDPALLPPFLPPDPAGHVLITTRAADLSELDLGLADPLALDVLPPE